MSTLPTYDESLVILRARGVIGHDEAPLQPMMMAR